ncbi:hypothetical protein, partial [Pseudomonas sp. HY7a-MNA-CIBAN-0227]
LHPYRTITQHYPSTIQRSRANNAEPNRSVANSTEQQLTSNHAALDEQDSLQNGLKEVKDGFEGQLPAKGLEHYLQEQEKNLI